MAKKPIKYNNGKVKEILAVILSLEDDQLDYILQEIMKEKSSRGGDKKETISLQ